MEATYKEIRKTVRGNIKDFQCLICQKLFGHKNSFKKHLKIVKMEGTVLVQSRPPKVYENC